MEERQCKYCEEKIKGRLDKLFCNAYCKSAYHYKIKRENEEPFFVSVDKQLKINRRLLKEYNKAGKSTVRKELLIDDGFNPKFFTHYWKNKKNDVYLFCYEYGFLERSENDKAKFLLVKWQKYMNQ